MTFESHGYTHGSGGEACLHAGLCLLIAGRDPSWHAGSEKELSLGSSPQESRLTQPRGSPGLRLSSPASGAVGLAALQSKGPSSSKPMPTPSRDKGMSPGKFTEFQRQLDAMRAKLQV